MAVPKAGYKGAVYIGSVKVGGATTWGYSGSTRNMHAGDQFEDEIIPFVPLQIEGGEITITGNYLMASDDGQKLLAARFADAAEITNLLLYISKTDDHYKTPDDSTSPASYVTVTNYDNIGDDKSGVGTFTATLKVSGVLKPMPAV